MEGSTGWALFGWFGAGLGRFSLDSNDGRLRFLSTGGAGTRGLVGTIWSRLREFADGGGYVCSEFMTLAVSEFPFSRA